MRTCVSTLPTLPTQRCVATGFFFSDDGFVRPDIAYAAGIDGRLALDPSEEHWTAVKRILLYLKGTHCDPYDAVKARDLRGRRRGL
jgi:hypothetical protein